MILRSIALRHGNSSSPLIPTLSLITLPGRRALVKPPLPLRALPRYFASQVESTDSSHTTTDDATSNPFEHQQYVAGGIGRDKSSAMHSLPARYGPNIDMTVASKYHAFERQKKLTQPIGTTLAPHYQPHTLLSNPPSPKDITLELLLASQAHLGHATSLWNPANARYIYGIRQGIHIISLDVTASHLRRACSIVKSVAEVGGLILFVGTRNGHDRAVVKAAELAGACHLFDRWIPGTITNGPQILGGCGIKVVNNKDEYVPGFESQLDSYGALKPDLVVCLNPLENWVLLHECGLNGIPTIGVIDTDANPTWVTYPIPANDDSLRTIQVIAGVLGRAGQEGQAIRKEKAAKGIKPFRFLHNLQPRNEETMARDTSFVPGRDTPLDDSRTVTFDADQVGLNPNNANLLAAFEAARFANFDEEAVDEALELFDVLPAEAPLSPELESLRNKLQDARRAHGLPETDDESSEEHLIPAETADELEAETRAMMDEPMTPEEAAAFYQSNAGGRGDNIYAYRTFRESMRHVKSLADPALAQMIALKRREFNEELSEADKEVLAAYDAEVRGDNIWRPTESDKKFLAEMNESDKKELERLKGEGYRVHGIRDGKVMVTRDAENKVLEALSEDDQQELERLENEGYEVVGVRPGEVFVDKKDGGGDDIEKGPWGPLSEEDEKFLSEGMKEEDKSELERLKGEGYKVLGVRDGKVYITKADE